MLASREGSDEQGCHTSEWSHSTNHDPVHAIKHMQEVCFQKEPVLMQLVMNSIKDTMIRSPLCPSHCYAVEHLRGTLHSKAHWKIPVQHYPFLGILLLCAAQVARFASTNHPLSVVMLNFLFLFWPHNLLNKQVLSLINTFAILTRSLCASKLIRLCLYLTATWSISSLVERMV